MKAKFVVIIFILFLLTRASEVLASENRFVTIVNPVRISNYTADVSKSISTQYSIVHERDLSGTWLLTYDVLSSPSAIGKIDEFDSKQEIGVFIEVSSGFANSANVTYNETGSWHHANSVLTTGYTQKERLQLIDALFEKYKSIFNVYPKSVGAWWIDSFSLSYMQEKYGVTGYLSCADQFSTDGYQIWGTYWSLPYTPYKFHSGIPAANQKDAIPIVITQWAPRDPYLGYYSSLYSTQDYFTKPNLSIEYFEKLFDIYTAREPFGFIVVGLEGDLNPESYRHSFLQQLNLVKEKVSSNEVKDLTMSDFSDRYIGQYKYTNRVEIVASNDGESEAARRTWWFQSPNYRLGMSYNKLDKKLTILDIRNYKNTYEPYYFDKNPENILHINIPSLVDSVSDSNTTIVLSAGTLIDEIYNGSDLSLVFDNGSLVASDSKLVFNGFSQEKNNLSKLNGSYLSWKKDTLQIQFVRDNKYINGYKFRDITEEGYRILSRKRNVLLVFLILSTIFIVNFIAFKMIKSRLLYTISLFVLMLIIAFLGLRFYLANSKEYFVSPDEIEALEKLKLARDGDVLVYDSICFGCSWNTEYEPAALANKKKYIEKFSSKNTINEIDFFETSSLEEAKQRFIKSGATYIYITKYSGRVEKVPFSPGDFGIELLYENANAEVWVKKI